MRQRYKLQCSDLPVRVRITDSEKMRTAQDIANTLKAVFGYDSFRAEQEAIIEAHVAGRDVLAILPTGGGKSLCYQLPALLRDGLTVVVSPLIALMKDQVDQMEAAGVKATFLNSSISYGESQDRLNGLRAGRYKLLYLAPERLFMEGFLQELKAWGLSAIAVDEAHCISAWGHQFRPEYRQLSELRKVFPGVPVIALTATATERVRRDIVAQLKLENPGVFVASFNRPNLHYKVVQKKKVLRQASDFAKARPDESGIIYCLAKKTTEEFAEELVRNGIKALPYHAGLPDHERARNQEAFIRDDVQVICATIAFGMGINKPNVRYVMHADLPKNIESYYQETGRAGRDGLPSECLLLFSGGDVQKNMFFIKQLEDEQEARIASQQLRQMAGFAENTGCRRSSLLRYFGECMEGENCQSCDNCQDGKGVENVTEWAVKLIYCVDMIAKSGWPMGLKHAVDVLRGSKNAKILQKGHDRLKAYGKGHDQSVAYWMTLGKQMLQHGYFEIPDDGYSTLSITPKSIQAVNQKEQIMLKLPALKAVKEPRQPSSCKGDVECDDGLFEELRQLRKQLADDRGVPPYVVFGDVTLKLMARELPQTDDAFLKLSGVGERRLADFGAAFMKTIAEWLEKEKSKSSGGSDAEEGSSVTGRAGDKSRDGKETIKELRNLALEIGNAGKNKERLIDFFLHPDYEIRRRACSAAAKLRDAQIVSHIGPCVSADEPQIRQYALKAIYQSRCRSLIEEVRALENIEDKEYNQRLISRILSDME